MKTIIAKILGLATFATTLLAAPLAHAVPFSLTMQTDGFGYMFGNDATPLPGPLNVSNFLSVRNPQLDDPAADIQSIIRFDTSALTPLLTSGQPLVVNSARLQLDFLGQGGEPTTTRLNAGLGGTDSWTQASSSTELWNNYTQVLGNTLFVAGTPEGLVEIDLPGLSIDDFGNDELLSLLLFADENLGPAFNELFFGAGDTPGGTTGAAPRLILDISVRGAEVPEPGSLLLVGLGLGAFAVVRRRRA